jgi:hypothetical protein
MPKDNRNLEIESRLTKLETSLDEVKNNHLAHMARDIKDIAGKIDKIQWFFITSLVGILMLLIRVFLP